MENFRILHILSPLKWNGNVFNSKADSNWKVCEKTIRFLPNCHHYIVVPSQHDIELNDANITFVKYDYAKTMMLNRGMFNFKQIKFDFDKIDVDFVFTHQSELSYTIFNWFHTNRYYEDVAYFGFYHWIDCNKSRGSVTGCPSFFWRQLEAMNTLDANFVHSPLSIEYLKLNFDIDISSLIKNVYEMPLSSKFDVEATPFYLPNKKILVFNHRWNESSGVRKLIEYSKLLPEEYVVWITDEGCDEILPNFIVKHLKYSDYIYLIQNCYASLCFINGYSTWNLSAQDSILMGKPLIYFDHPTIKLVVGEDNNGFFKTKEEFLNLLENLPNVDATKLYEHDFIFELQLKSAMKNYWQDTKKPPLDTQRWINAIDGGFNTKRMIMEKVYYGTRATGSQHYIRRHLLHNGFKDNIKNAHSEYYREGKENMIKRDLFNQL
jgi:glycosyltransferase involved in cell wall biosynthesis